MKRIHIMLHALRVGAVAIAGLILGLGAATSASAQSVVFHSEGFEVPPGPQTLSFQGSAGIDRDLGFAKSGRNNAWIRTREGFSAIKLRVAMHDVFDPRVDSARLRARCTGHFYMRSSPNLTGLYVTILDDFDNPIAELGPHSAESLRQQPGGYGWVDIPSFERNADNYTYKFTLRIGFWGNGSDAWAQIDDIAFTCGP